MVEKVRKRGDVGGWTVEIGSVSGYITVALEVSDVWYVVAKSNEQLLGHWVRVGGFRVPKVCINTDRSVCSFQLLEKNTSGGDALFE